MTKRFLLVGFNGMTDDGHAMIEADTDEEVGEKAHEQIIAWEQTAPWVCDTTRFQLLNEQ